MKFARTITLCLMSLALLAPQSNARPLRGVAIIGAAQGFVQTNMSASDIVNSTSNLMSAMGNVSFGGNATPASIDSRGYPSATLSGADTVSYGLGSNFTYTGSSVPQVLTWTPTGTGSLPFEFFGLTWGNIVVVSAGNCTAANNGTGGSAKVVITGGLACRITFTWNTPPQSGTSLRFLAGTWAAGSSAIYIGRASDEATTIAGNNFTPEYVGASGLFTLSKWKTIRNWPWMGDLSGNTNLSQYKYRATPDTIGWGSQHWFPGAYSGSISNSSDQFTATAPTDLALTAWADGESLQGSVVSASTINTTISNIVASNGTTNCPGVTVGLACVTVSSSANIATNQPIYISNVNGTSEANGYQVPTVIDGTHIALQGVTFANAYTGGSSWISIQTLTVTGKTTVAGIAAVPVARINGQACSSSCISTGLGTFTYNAALRVILYTTQGYGTNVPIESQVYFANLLNVNLWMSFPYLANDDFVTQMSGYVRDNLKPALWMFGEYSNEVWNPGFPQFTFAFDAGQYLNVGSQVGYTGLRSRQIFGLMSAAWASTGRSATTLKATSAFQAYGDSTTVTSVLNGSQLNPASNQNLCRYLGGTYSGSCSLSASFNYSTVGNRPVDLAASLAYANYITGATIRGASGYGSYTAYELATLTSIVSNYNSGSTSAAYTLMDADFRYGTINQLTVSSVSTTTINSAANGLSNNIRGYFSVSGGTLSSWGITSQNQAYFVVSAATNSFGVSLAQGGSAVSLTTGTGTLSFNTISTGTATFGLTSSLLGMASTIYQNAGGQGANPGWQSVAASYNGVGGRASNARVDLYEGGLEAIPPTTTECQTIGFSTTSTITFRASSGVGTWAVHWVGNGLHNGDRVSFTNSGGALPGGIGSGTQLWIRNASTDDFDVTSAYFNTGLITPASTGTGTQTGLACPGVDNVIDGYKNSSSAYALAQDIESQFIGTDSNQPMTSGLMANSWTPSWFIVTGMSNIQSVVSPWSLVPNAYPGSTPYQTYNGLKDWVGKLNFLLKRDMQEPGSANDNDPMWLEKAA